MSKITWEFTGKEATHTDVVDSCGSGWAPLIEKLIDDLFTLGWDGVLFQVKEKFGGLRFYIGNGSKEIHDRIYKAEVESQSICIKCGKPAKLYTDGWWLPLCDEHAKELGREQSDDTGFGL